MKSWRMATSTRYRSVLQFASRNEVPVGCPGSISAPERVLRCSKTKFLGQRVLIGDESNDPEAGNLMWTTLDCHRQGLRPIEDDYRKYESRLRDLWHESA